jgi:hypothetical protein
MTVQHDNKAVFKTSLLLWRNVTLGKNGTLVKKELTEKFQLFQYC